MSRCQTLLTNVSWGNYTTAIEGESWSLSERNPNRPTSPAPLPVLQTRGNDVAIRHEVPSRPMPPPFPSNANAHTFPRMFPNFLYAVAPRRRRTESHQTRGLPFGRAHGQIEIDRGPLTLTFPFTSTLSLTYIDTHTETEPSRARVPITFPSQFSNLPHHHEIRPS